MSDSIRNVFAASGLVSALALVFGFMLPPGPPAPARREETLIESDGERFVMAEMTVIDREHEPSCTDLEEGEREA
jgi:hypothetical protein